VSVTDDAHRTDGELVAALNDPSATEAWRLLVARHTARMFAVARSFNLDAATAEDLVQTAWLRLLERVDQLRDRDALGPWLCTIVRNEARRLVVRRREIPTSLSLDLKPDPSGSVDARTLETERSTALRLAFSRLSDECQQLLRLSVAEPPLSYDEIAAAVGRPRGSLGPTRRRCLEQLRLRLPPGFEP
jgi:RNA polymerase sigma factor (sigma-70 family)